jgi:hypothetical protein
MRRNLYIYIIYIYYMNIILCTKACLYDNTKDETTIYGQYTRYFTSVLIDDTIPELVFCRERPDFYIKLKGKVSSLQNIRFMENTTEIVKLEDIHLHFPFEDCDLQIHSTSAIISTFCKHYSHRLDEWIQYNLKLGFSGIVIFNNNGNISNPLNEPAESYVQTQSMEEICNKYKGKVWMIDFPYSPFYGQHYDNIQRLALHIGVNTFRNKCRNIALIDADEFIYLPKNKSMNIESFLQEHSTITMQSNILTNKNTNDVLNNNILELAKYIGEDKYKKTILHTDKITDHEFIITPHEHRSERFMSKEDIIHYHCWMNTRYTYHETMPTIDLLAL